uniref:Uncharacterized protein n=1 Tax=Globodera rostochiensis TaxID=31243 RepID=A0A914H2Y0_GLORO
MQLVHNCEQTLAKDSSRRLLVYEKFRQPLVEGTDQQRERAHFELDCYAEKTFRQKVFNNNSSEGAKGEKESLRE